MFRIARKQDNSRSIVQSLAVMVMVLALCGLQPPAAQAQGCTFPMTASNETELNTAIACYNGATSPGEYTITLGGNILLTGSTTTINNTTANVRLRIDGAGFSMDGQDMPGVRPFEIDDDTVVTMQAITITRGNADEGGGIRNDGTLTILNSTISNNIASFAGGGIYNEKGTLTVINSLISSNRADSLGGGIYNDDRLTITASTISSNTAGNGGGVYNVSGGNLTSINSTFSGNRASGLGGGGIDNYSGTLNLINNTFSGNSANAGSGIYHQTGWLYMVNTVLSNNLPGGNDCLLVGDVYKHWMSPDIGNNLIESTGEGACRIPAGSNGNIMGQPAQLGPLQDNGGPTLTHALLAGSPAIDAGNNVVCADPATVNNLDQRGVTRPQGPTCDIGAVERERLYTWGGFYAPVENLPVVNTVNAGQALPLKFSLGGDFGLDIFASGYPNSQQVACGSGGSGSSPVEETLTAGKSELQYDPASGLYTYVWKTAKSWAGTCRLLTVRLNDGTEQNAFFQFNGKGGRGTLEQAEDEAANALYLPLVSR